MEPAAELRMDESLPVDDPELSEGVRLVKLASIVLQFLGSDLGILAGPSWNSYARMAKPGPGVSLSVSQSRILGWTLWRPRRAREGPCMYALSRRPLSVIYSDSESCADIAAKNCYSKRTVVSMSCAITTERGRDGRGGDKDSDADGVSRRSRP